MDSLKTQYDYLQDFLKEWESGKGITVFTSGSTGMPKEIKLSHEQILRSAKRTINFFGIVKKSRIHSAISFRFIGGKMMIARSLVSGCDLTFSSPSLYPELKGEESVALLAAVPAQMPYILSHVNDFKKVNAILLGGSAIHDSLWSEIVKSGLNVWESYGMTETASHIALRRVIGSSDNRPYFVSLPGVKVTQDFENCLHIIDGDVRVATNDIVEFNDNGGFLVLGRKDDVIISGGLKIIPQEIERKINSYIKDLTDEYCVVPEPDKVWTTRICLACVPNLKNDPIRHKERKDLENAIQKRIEEIPETLLPKKFKPKNIKIIDKLPLTPSGKLMRNLVIESGIKKDD